LPAEPQALTIGTGEILREGDATGSPARAGVRVALIGYGTGVQKALEAADRLAGGDIAVTVVDAASPSRSTRA